MNSVLKNPDNYILYKAGRLTITMNFSMTARGFYPIETFDMTQFDQRQLSVFVFGLVNDDLTGDFSPSLNLVSEAHTDTPFAFNSASGGSRADPGFELKANMLSIGIRNTSNTAQTVIAPFYDATVDYFIFYY